MTDTTNICGDWIEWSGGENPVPGKRVEVEFQIGGYAFAPSHDLRWFYDGAGHDIIAYRVVSPTQQAAKTGEGDYVLVPRKAVRSMTMAGCDRLPAVDGVFGVAGALCSNVWDAMVEVGEKLATEALTDPRALTAGEADDA